MTVESLHPSTLELREATPHGLVGAVLSATVWDDHQNVHQGFVFEGVCTKTG